MWAIENPGNSWLWEIPDIVSLMPVSHFVEFAACAWGSKRPTKKAFLTTC